MKVSEIQVSNVAEYLKLESGEYTSAELTALLTVSKNFISSYTGIPITSEEEGIKDLDDFEDFYIVVMVLCQDMYDNRSLYVDKNNLNKVVETILGMHSRNLL
jgi:hypothetical protein